MVEPTFVALAGVGTGWVIIAVAMVMGRQPSAGIKVRRRNMMGSLGILLQGAGFAIAFGWHRATFDPVPISWGASVAALTLALGSAAFMCAAIRTLGKQWSLLPRLLEGHALIDRGPYAVVRHPIYTSMMGMMIATGVALGPDRMLLFAVVLYATGTMIRIRMEERLLTESFGESYPLYMTRVAAFVPFVHWPR